MATAKKAPKKERKPAPKPEVRVPERAEKPIEIPPAEPQSIPAPTDPVISAAIAVPPSAFDHLPAQGTLAFALLNDPSKDVSRVVTKHFSKPHEPWYSEWNSASEAGDPCIRRVGYQRLHPEQALPDSDDLAFTFRHGHWIEKEIYAELAEAGYEVIEQQRTFVDQELRVKGKIDGKIIMNWNGARYKPPFDAKGYAPDTWNNINSAKDFLDSDRPYLKKVPAQITLYLVMDKEQTSKVGMVYMKNKITGRPKQVVIPMVDAYVDWLMTRIRMLNEYVAAKKLPPRIEYDEKVCGKCPFRAVCLKEMPPGVDNPVVLNPEQQAELLELIEEREKLDPARKHFKHLDDKISDIVKGHPKIILGNFIISGKWISQERINSKIMPEKVRKKYLGETTYWKKDIVSIRAQAPDEA